MKIIQMLPSLAFGDAVGNDALALQKALRELGYETALFAEAVDSRLPKKSAWEFRSRSPVISQEDVILYHMSTGSKLNETVGNYPCRKIMIYHNITPPEFFHAYSLQAETNARYGLDGLTHLSDKIDYCLADSEFNRQDLRRAGFSCPVDIRPILIPFDDYTRKPDSHILKRFSDDAVNFLFVGRIAPNKKQEDIISAFACYQKHLNPQSRLILAGSWNGMELYYDRLQRYAQALEVHDVLFTGHISFPELLAYYQTADIFLCMSEHEGFCVPLAEAMYFDIPVIAYRSSAVPETLGNGLLIDAKHPMETALLAGRVLTDESLRHRVLANQRERLKDFQYEKIKALFAFQLEQFREHQP